MVFIPDPITTSGDLTLTDVVGSIEDGNSYTLNSQRKCVRLQGLDSSGKLSGQYAQTMHQGPIEPSQVFNYLRGGSSHHGFEQAMVYYHVDRNRRYLETLGLVPTPLQSQPIRFAVNVNEENQSRFIYKVTEPGELHIGSGGVDDAEDGMMILHEYAHAIQRGFVPRWGQSGGENAAMNEGFADYWAASAFVGSAPAGHNPILDDIFAPWDFTGRVLNSTKHYPENMTGQPHADGEIWSACLWQIMKLPGVGKERADRLFLEALKRTASPNIPFKDYAELILEVNSLLYGGQDQSALEQVFVDRGIIIRLIGLTLSSSVITGGTNLTGQVFLSSKAPVNGVTITLTSNNTAASVNQTVVVPFGQVSENFLISTSVVSTTISGDIIASYDAKNLLSDLTVEP